MDLYSTICELGGATPGPGTQATSLVPILAQHPNHTLREAVFSENYFGRMVRWKEWKLVYYPGKPYGELYNLADDPDEQENLYGDMEGSREKQYLKDLLLEWSFASEDELPLPARLDHQDESPRDLTMEHGCAVELSHQHWYLDHLTDLYKNWDFSQVGENR